MGEIVVVKADHKCISGFFWNSNFKAQPQGSKTILQENNYFTHIPFIWILCEKVKLI